MPKPSNMTRRIVRTETKPKAPPMKLRKRHAIGPLTVNGKVVRRRTHFPCRENFTGWWVRSKVGTVGQLKRCGTDTHESFLYRLFYPSTGQLGNREWTTEELMEAGATILPEEPK